MLTKTVHQECTVIVFKESGDQDLAKLGKLFIVIF